MTRATFFLLLLVVLALVVIWRRPRKTVRSTYAIGVRTAAGRFTELVSKGVVLPFLFADRFHNAVDDQDNMMIELMRDDDGVLHRLDRITLNDLPLRPMGMVDLEMRLIVSRRHKLTMTIQSEDAKILKTYGPYNLV